MVSFPERLSSDEVACAKRLTVRKLAGAWSLAGLLLAGLAVASFAQCGLQRLVSYLPIAAAAQMGGEADAPQKLC